MRTLTTQAAPAPEFSAQIPAAQTEKQQVNPLRLPRTPNREPSQVRRLLLGDCDQLIRCVGMKIRSWSKTAIADRD